MTRMLVEVLVLVATVAIVYKAVSAAGHVICCWLIHQHRRDMIRHKRDAAEARQATQIARAARGQRVRRLEKQVANLAAQLHAQQLADVARRAQVAIARARLVEVTSRFAIHRAEARRQIADLAGLLSSAEHTVHTQAELLQQLGVELSAVDLRTLDAGRAALTKAKVGAR